MKKTTFNQMTNPSCSERDWNGGKSRVSRGNPRLYSFLPRTLLVLITLLTLGVGQIWAYWYVPGTINGTRWGTTDNNMGGDNTITFYAVAAGTYSFQLTNGSSWGGNGCIESISGATKGTDGSNATITTTAVKDITITVVDEGNWKVSVTASDPTYHIKYQFGGSWDIKTLKSNGDGTYSCNGNYSGNASSGFNYIKVSSEGDDFMNWTTSGITRENSPSSTSDKCIFTFKPSDNTLKIRKCNTVTKTNYIYFYNRHSWSDSYIYFVIGHPDYSQTYRVTNIANTKLYYVANSSDNWTDAGYYGMIGAGSTFGGGSWGQSNLTAANHYTAAYTTAKNLASGKTILVKPNSTNSNGLAMTISSDMSSYTGLNYSQTVQKRTCTGANDPSSVANYRQTEINSGTVTISAYKMTGNGTASNTSNSATLDEASETSASVDAAYSGKVTYTASANTGYTFVGWATTALGSIASTDATYNRYPTETSTVYARFKENQYTAYVQTYTHGSSPSPSSATTMGQITGGSISVTPNTGYRFVNWTLNSGSGSFADANSASTTFYPTSNSQLRANIVAKTYNIRLHGNGGSDGSVTATFNSSELADMSDASYAGHSLNGYYTAKSGGTQIIDKNGALVSSTVEGYLSSGAWVGDTVTVLYAQWTEDLTYYDVTFAVGTSYTSLGSLSATNNSTSSAISSGDDLVSGTSVTFTATPNTGYVVEGWYTDDACTAGKHDAGSTTYTIASLSSAVTVYVKFVEKTWSVAFAAGTGGTVTTPNSTPRTVGQLTGISIAATPSTGYTFNTWTITSGSGSFTSEATTNSNTFKPTADATVTASFTETMSTLTTSCHYDVGDPKYSVPSKSASSIGISTTADLTAAAPSTGYTFVGWTLTHCERTSGEANSRNITVRSDGSGEAATAVANYEEDLTTTWYIAGDGNGTGTDLTPGSPFSGWGTSGTRMSKKSGHSTEEIYYCNITVSTVATTDAHFPFQVFDGTNHRGYNNYWITKENNYTTVYTGNPTNMKFRPYVTGTYEFKVDNTGSDPVLTVTWPVFNQVRISTASPADASNVGNYDMSDPVSNVRSVTRSLNANTTYTFKIMYNSDWYGYNSGTFTRSTSTSSNSLTTSTSGGNMTLTTDYAGDYTFKFNQSTKALSVDFPTAYKVTYGKGSVDGSASNCSAVDIDNSSAAVTSNSTWVKSGNRVVLTAPAAKEGYTYNGWFNNNSGTGEAITTAANCTITVTSAATYYACYSINNHTITHSAATNGSYTIKVGSLDPVSTNTTADYAQTITLAATPATGYHFGSWTVTKSPSGSVTVTSNQFTMPDADVTVAAAFAANNYTITLNNHGATTAGTTSVSVTYNATTGLTSDITVPEKDGYTFGGYYTEEGGSGTQLISAAGKWQKGNTWINAGGNWVNAGDLTLHAKWTANNYTVTFDATTNGGTCATASKSVTFDAAYGELPVATHASRQFVGWYTTASDDPTPGTRVTAETIVSNPSNHILYARFESTFEVTVTYKCGEDVLYPSNKVYASASSLAADISAPEILGYRFVNWTGSNATFGDPSSATTTVNASALTTITANYVVVPTVYFKNNLGWDSVFVTFDCSFIDGKQNVPSNNGHPYFAMTQLGSTDIFYCEIPDSIVANTYAKWKWNIAFDNTNYGKTATTTHVGTWDFYGGECTGRGDFDPNATMFIPFNGDTEVRNTTTFYKTGCWMKYNSTDPGYQVKINKWVTGANSDTCTVSLSAPVAGGYEFSGKVWLKAASYGYGFKLYKPYRKNTNDLWYSNNGSIHSNTTTLPWEFATKIIVDEVEQAVTADTRRCELYTEAVGDYEFTVSFATGKPVVNVTYPVSAGDYRLVYNDNATWSNDAHDASWIHPSRVIKAKANAEDIISFYIAYGSSPSILLQKCTSIDGRGNPVWDTGTSVTIGATATGIYNYKVTQDENKDATVTFDGSYDGNFYIRTDVSDGGWSNYKTSGANTMTYSEYAEDNSGFTHYYMRYVNAGQNIKFCIANDYSECISDTLVDDDYTEEWIEAYANVRFMWDHRTNKISRAYISGSSNISDRFLVLEGSDKMFDEAGNALTDEHQVAGLEENEMNFIDDQNWIYEATIKAKPGAKALLTAKYNNKVQYFGGSGPAVTDSVQLIGGSDANKYKVRVVYDFKTNRLIKAFIPDGAIGTDLEIEADLMIIRDHQEDAQQITFSGSGKLSDVKTVYGAMKFNKWTLNNKDRSTHEVLSLSTYERDLFYISFPFDVKLSEVFGFGTYGKHWILEYYDGVGRATNGFWAESDPNWKFVMPSQRSSFTMKAFKGYILALDLDELTESSSVWNNNVENVYLYFPSTAEVEDIEATNRLIEIDQEGYECTINRSDEPKPGGGTLGPDYDRRVKDSYWHCIGVPSFANYNSALSETSGGTTIDWRSTSMPYLYEVNFADKSLSITSSATFNFKATWSYLVQYAGASIYWSQVNVTPSSVVARRANKEAPTNAEFCIELQKEGEKADQTFVRLTNDENVTTGFDFNYDLSKEFNRNKANIYTIVTSDIDGDLSTTETAGNCLPMSEQTTIVPMGVQIAKAGEYTISIPSGTNGVGVTLIDNETGLRTNLALEDYRVELDAATYNNRFIIEISPIVSVLTGVEQTAVSGQSSDVRKVIIDQKMYIIKDGKVYDAQGARVR